MPGDQRIGAGLRAFTDDGGYREHVHGDDDLGGCTVSPYQGPLCLVKVEVQYPFKFVLSFGRTVIMTAYSEMIISQ